MRYVLIFHDSGWGPEYHEFESKKDAEEFLWKWALEVVDIDALKEIDPKGAKRLSAGPSVVYDFDFCWGENDSCCVMLFEVDDRGVARCLIPGKTNG